MTIEDLALQQQKVERADAAARAARDARDATIVQLVTSGEATAYRIAKTIGVTEGAVRKIVQKAAAE